jgi:hypothetical protein
MHAQVVGAGDGDRHEWAVVVERWRLMKPRSFASSHTGRRGHDVRHASITSAYGRGAGPIQSRRSRIRLSTLSGMGA